MNQDLVTPGSAAPSRLVPQAPPPRPGAQCGCAGVSGCEARAPRLFCFSVGAEPGPQLEPESESESDLDSD
ncbi:hypothetical protein H8959_014394 [Pygathrix nigripes]